MSYQLIYYWYKFITIDYFTVRILFEGISQSDKEYISCVAGKKFKWWIMTKTGKCLTINFAHLQW